MDRVGFQKVALSNSYGNFSLGKAESLDDREMLKSMFDLMKGVTSTVRSGDDTQGTGFFARIKEVGDFFLTASHILEKHQVTYVSEKDRGLLVDKIEDVALLDVFSKEKQKITPIEIAPDKEEIYIGKAVYFVGFPFGKNVHTFHQGRVSAVYGNKFSIDATVVAGHSGSPIFGFSEDHQHLYIFGMVSSQSIDSMRNVRYLCNHEDENIRNIGTIFKANLSSGIGTGIDIRRVIKPKDKKSIQDEFDKYTSGSSEEKRKDPDDGELPIGKKNRDSKRRKKLKKQAKQTRAESKKSGDFKNVGVPSILYRFVSKRDAKAIDKNGIQHTGNHLDAIPFLAQPREGMAKSVGARVTKKMVSVQTDLIPNLSTENISKVSERNGVVTYRINISIPPEAITISEAS